MTDPDIRILAGLAEQIKCVEREIRMRNRVYPRWVQQGKMSPPMAATEQMTMEAVLATLQMLATVETPAEMADALRLLRKLTPHPTQGALL